MDPKQNPNRKWSVSWQFTQPYSVSMNEIYNRSAVAQELERMDLCEKWIETMLTYPDAEAIINKVKQQGDL